MSRRGADTCGEFQNYCAVNCFLFFSSTHWNLTVALVFASAAAMTHSVVCNPVNVSPFSCQEQYSCKKQTMSLIQSFNTPSNAGTQILNLLLQWVSNMLSLSSMTVQLFNVPSCCEDWATFYFIKYKSIWYSVLTLVVPQIIDWVRYNQGRMELADTRMSRWRRSWAKRQSSS